MARAVAQYVFAALLALLTAQTAVPSRHLVSSAEIVWCAETDRQAAEQIRPIHVDPLANSGSTLAVFDIPLGRLAISPSRRPSPTAVRKLLRPFSTASF